MQTTAVWLVLGLVAGTALANSDHYDTFLDFLRDVNHKLARLDSEVDKLMFSELVEAAELGELKEFIDRVGLIEVLKFFEHLDEDESSYFADYLKDHFGYKHETLDHHSHWPWNPFGRRFLHDFKFPGGFGGFSGFLGHMWEINQDLPAYEKGLLFSLTSAVHRQELTQWLEKHGYGALFDIIAELHEDHAHELERYVERQLAHEAGMV